MAGPYILDRVKETSTTTGTGPYTLAGAVAGFQAFSAVGNANTCFYCAENGVDWEVGIGTYTLSGTTLARTTILKSSNSNAAVSWSAGTRNIHVVDPADWFGSPLIPGSVLFAGVNGLLDQDNANWFFDKTNKRLGIRTATPLQALDLDHGSIRFDHVAVPGACAAALAAAGAGNVDNGPHAYKVTFVTADGETVMGSGVVVTVVNKATDGKVALTGIPTGTAGVVTGRNVYRTKTGGGPFYLLTSIADNTTTTFTDNVADSSLVTSPPSNNTTAGSIVGSTGSSSFSGGGTLIGLLNDKGGTVQNVKSYGALSGVTNKTNGAMTAASAVLTSSGFAAGDEGKICSVAWAGINQVANPTTAATVVVTGGGSTGGILAAGDYRVKYTWVTTYGETTGGTSESTVFTVVYGNIPRVTIPSLPANAIGANIYLTPVGGTTNTETQYLFGVTGTTADLALTARSDGLAVPSVNKTAAPLVSVIKTFTNSTTVTLADAATNTVASADVIFGWDSTDAFQAAIDAGTGTVFVPSGNYMVSQLKMKSSVLLRGAGYASSIFQRPGFNGHMIIANDNTVQRIGLVDFLMNGKKFHQTTANEGIHIDITGATGDMGSIFMRVRVEYFRQHGQYMGGDVRGCLTLGMYYLYNDGINLFVDATSTDSAYLVNVGGQSGLQGCKIAGNNNNFLENKFFWSGQITTALGYSHHVTANNNELTGCTGQDSQSHDLYLDGCLRTAVNNFIFDNSRQDACRINAGFDNTVRGTSLSFVRNQRASIINLIGGSLRNVADITFDAGAVATGNEYVIGTPTGNDVSRVGPTGGYQTPAFPGTRTWTVVSATDVITTNTAHGLNVNEPVYVTNSGGALPASTPQIAINVIYYVKTVPSSTTLTISATPGGTTIDFTGTGTGTQTVQLPLQPNAYLGNVHAITLTGDMPIALPVRKHQGQKIAFHLLQDGTGGRKMGFTSEFTVIEFLPRTSANQLNIIEFTYNGTTWVQTGGQFTAAVNVSLLSDYAITTTEGDVTDSSGNILRFAIGDSEKWSFEFNLQTGSSSAAGIAFALTTPSGATFRAVLEGMTTAVTATTSSIMTVSGTQAIAVNTVALNTGWVKICGTIRNSTTDGFVTLRADKVTSGTGTVFADSYLTARRVS